MKWTVVGSVESDSEPGVRYAIKQRGELLGCDCLSYRFKRGEKTCKHTQAYLAGEAGDARPFRQAVPSESVRVKSASEMFTVRRSITFGAMHV